MATIPEVRKELQAISQTLAELIKSQQEELALVQDRLLQCEKELHRRPAIKRAPPRKRPVASTPEAIRIYAAQNPGLDNHLIAIRFGINTARVSEALAGKRV
jgi:hypothetical protein